MTKLQDLKGLKPKCYLRDSVFLKLHSLGRGLQGNYYKSINLMELK